MATAVAKDQKDSTGFGPRLKALRESRSLSQQGLGDLCEPKMTYQTIARLERGGRTPSWDTVIRLAKALDVTPDEFLPKEESE